MGYAENMYQCLKRNGYADKYDHAGIYCIKIDNIISERCQGFDL